MIYEPLRLVVGVGAAARALAETASFEGFVTNSQARLFGSLCLMTGSRYEAEEIAGGIRPRARALGGGEPRTLGDRAA